VESFGFGIFYLALPLFYLLLPEFTVWVVTLDFIVMFLFSLFGAWKRSRWDLLKAVPLYFGLRSINHAVWILTSINELVLKRQLRVWLKADRLGTVVS